MSQGIDGVVCQTPESQFATPSYFWPERCKISYFIHTHIWLVFVWLLFGINICIFCLKYEQSYTIIHACHTFWPDSCTISFLTTKFSDLLFHSINQFPLSLFITDFLKRRKTLTWMIAIGVECHTLSPQSYKMSCFTTELKVFGCSLINILGQRFIKVKEICQSGEIRSYLFALQFYCNS